MSSNLYPAANTSMNLSTSLNANSSSYFEPESQIILRMPLVKGDNGMKKVHPKAVALREALLSRLATMNEKPDLEENPAPDDLKDRLFIELNTESRKGRIKFDDEIFEARLVDLPCIVESLKTTDKKMFYKTADICQMLVCRTQDDPWNSSDEERQRAKKVAANPKASKKESKHDKYKWPHGLAPPLKNVRRKRFRKVAKKKMVDYAEIETEVKQIFRADREAYKIDYEVLLVEGELEDEDELDKNGDKDNSLGNEDEYDSDLGVTVDYGNSCMDSAMDGSMMDASQASKTMGQVGKPILKRTLKASNLIDESNMSYCDEDSMMAPPTPIDKAAKRGQVAGETDAEDGEATQNHPKNFDECSVDVDDSSNLPDDKAAKERTGFKDLFVQDVLGDLSSSEEEEDEEEATKQSENKKATFKFNLDKNSTHVSSKDPGQTGEESMMSNLEEDSNMGFPNPSESETSNSKFGADEMRRQVNKTKNLDIFDANSRNPDDTDNDVSLEATTIKKDKTQEDLNFSDLSSSSNSVDEARGKDNKSELNAKLSRLTDELQRIREDREKRESEIKNINNPVLKAHLSSRLNNLIDEENKKQSEIEEIRAQLE